MKKKVNSKFLRLNIKLIVKHKEAINHHFSMSF